MDFFFDDLALPSSSQSTSDMQHEEPHGFTAETHLSPDMVFLYKHCTEWTCKTQNTTVEKMMIDWGSIMYSVYCVFFVVDH